MTRLNLVIISLFFFTSCVKKNHELNSANVKEDNLQIDEKSSKVEELKEACDNNDYQTFIKLFPDSYNELVNYYGFDEEKGAKPLYDVYEQHINYLFKNNTGDTYFFAKVYNISKNGKWDADAVGLFQTNLTNYIIKSPKKIIEYIADKNDSELKGFWFFIFDGSSKNDIQNKQKFDTIYKIIYSLDQRQALILKTTVQEMYK